MTPNDNKIMVVREILMEYFKGTCGERFADHMPLEILQDSEHIQLSTNRFEARRTIESRKPRRLIYENTPILSIAQHPDIVVLYVSGQLKKQIKQFLELYLPGVDITESREAVPGIRYEIRMDEDGRVDYQSLRDYAERLTTLRGGDI